MNHPNNEDVGFIFGSIVFIAVVVGISLASCGEGERQEKRAAEQQAQQVAQMEYKSHCDDLEGVERCKCLENLALSETGGAIWREKPLTRAAKTCWDHEKPVSKTKKVLRFVADRL